MKKIAFFLCMMILVVGTFGCGKKAEPTISPKDLVEKITTEFEFPMGMLLTEAEMETQKDFIDQILGADFKLDKVESFALYPPMMNVHAIEFGVIKVKDAKDVETYKAIAQKRVEAIQKNFETYLPDQYEIAKGGEVKVEGNYIIYVVAENKPAILEKTTTLLKESETK